MKKALVLTTIMLSALITRSQSVWTVCNSPVTEKLQSVSMPDMNKVLVGGKSGLLLMSTDYGNTFTSINLGISDDVNALYFFNTQNGIMLLGDHFMRTSDGGNNWTLISDVPGKPKGFFFTSQDTGYVACDFGLTFSTTNGGNSWNALTTGVTERLEAVYFKNYSEGFLGGRNQASLQTSNNGNSFTSNVIPANGDIKDIQFVSNTNGYTCGDNSEILFTSNGGLSWSPQSAPLNNVDMDALHFVDANNGWSSGEVGAMFHTTDGGNNWFLDVTNTSREINNVHLFDNLHGFAVCDSGTIIRLGNGSVSIDDQSLNNTSQLSVYPNPATNNFTFKSNNYGSESKISIMDVTGKTVYTCAMVNSSLAINTESIQLSPGIYMCKLESKNSSNTVRLIVK
ncbi:MAG: T9SS type A sorting domain-containing protein [Bacteroidetes bacterium]|nr:T9SS type A sorting domain-containing protein [Bacteroidota bacterium]